MRPTDRRDSHSPMSRGLARGVDLTMGTPTTDWGKELCAKFEGFHQDFNSLRRDFSAFKSRTNVVIAVGAVLAGYFVIAVYNAGGYANKVENIERDVASMKVEAVEIRKGLQDVDRRFGGLETGVVQIRDLGKQLQGDVATIRADFKEETRELRKDLRDGMKEVEGRLASVEKAVTGLGDLGRKMAEIADTNRDLTVQLKKTVDLIASRKPTLRTIKVRLDDVDVMDKESSGIISITRLFKNSSEAEDLRPGMRGVVRWSNLPGDLRDKILADAEVQPGEVQGSLVCRVRVTLLDDEARMRFRKMDVTDRGKVGMDVTFILDR